MPAHDPFLGTGQVVTFGGGSVGSTGGSDPPWFDTGTEGEFDPSYLGGTLENVQDSDEENLDIPTTIPDDVKQWRERVENYSPYNDVFSVQQQETSLTVDIPFNNRYLFVVHALGTAWVEDERIRRINPIRHPYWNWMRTARIAYKGVRFEGRKIFTQIPGVNNGVAEYKLARFTVGFANYPWEFVEDDDMPDDPAFEFIRNTWLEEVPSYQFLAAEGGGSVLKYAYTDTGGPKVGQPFRAQMGTIASQIRYVLHWKWVPVDYIYKGYIPTNIYKSMGKLNNDVVFTDFAKGTLLVEPPKITKFVTPVRYGSGIPYFCDIDINLTYFDPPQGVTTGPGAAWRGHNLAPYRFDNKWYPVCRPNPDGSTSTDIDNKGLFAYTDLLDIFRQAV